jgi:hypothetical protein
MSGGVVDVLRWWRMVVGSTVARGPARLARHSDGLGARLSAGLRCEVRCARAWSGVSIGPGW